MHGSKLFFAWAMLWIGMLANGTHALAASGSLDFNRDVRPILSAKCYACHGPDESSRKAKLRLDLREEAVKERDGKFAIKPGSTAKSELVRRITTKDADDIMPPPKSGHPLTKEEIAALKKWIEQGANFSQHWAFAPPQRAPLPKVSAKAWPKNFVDHFILARLEKEGLKPASAADPHTLIRRLSLDLTGLPPTPEEVETFVKEFSAPLPKGADKNAKVEQEQKAIAAVVDRLLASPGYGERWARVWLDLARYADSAGYGSDPLRMNIWPYRDWVIKAFNRNLPYDRFTLEQIAGDLLPDATEEQQTATAFHRNTMTNTEGGTDREEFRVAAVKDRIATTAQVWMGLTLGCAQCHSHKFDPISNREYYQFFALFNQTEDNDQPDEKPTLPLPTKEESEKMARLKREIAALEKEIFAPTTELLSELTKWSSAQAQAEWQTLVPAESKSAEGATLTKQADGSLLASGKSAEKDTYTVTVKTDLKNITALRLEVLPDESLPKKSTGRADDGHFFLSSLRVSAQAEKPETKRARFVRVEQPGEHRLLSLAEVQVFSGKTNVALKGKASQSSTDFGGAAALAIDGKTDGDYAKAKSTTHTKTEDNPWWEVDLGKEFALDEIVIWNRTDGSTGTRLTGFKVLALDQDRKTTFETTVSDPPSPSKSFSFAGEKDVTLANATADFSDGGNDAAKAIDKDEKTGWSVGATNTQSHVAIFETSGAVGGTNGTVLVFTLTQKKGKHATLGRFRLSAITQARPVRFVPKKITDLLANVDKRTDAQKQELANYYGEIAPSLAKQRGSRDTAKKDLDSVKPVTVPVMREVAKDKIRTTKMQVKGNFLITGDAVEAAFPVAFHAPPKDAPLNRVGVAQWLMSRENPLTARVAVNRFWAQLFGTGIVETEEDFGSQGALPSHPELLDALAVEFAEGGWDIKALLKTIVLSATYQQASIVEADKLKKDPRNRLLAHYPRRRLDAETLRDQALAISGLLSKKIGGPSVYPPQPDGLWRAAFNGQRSWTTSKGEDRYRRGLYTFWRRTVPYPSMATFDAPSRENCTMRRLPTNTPLQAFVTLNDPAFVEMAQALGRRLVKDGGATVAERACFGLKLALARAPSDEQVKALVSLYEAELINYRANADAAKKLATEPLGELPKDLDAAEAAAWTVVANVLLNLDGVLTKG